MFAFASFNSRYVVSKRHMSNQCCLPFIILITGRSIDRFINSALTALAFMSESTVNYYLHVEFSQENCYVQIHVNEKFKQKKTIFIQHISVLSPIFFPRNSKFTCNFQYYLIQCKSKIILWFH